MCYNFHRFGIEGGLERADPKLTLGGLLVGQLLGLLVEPPETVTIMIFLIPDHRFSALIDLGCKGIFLFMALDLLFSCLIRFGDCR